MTSLARLQARRGRREEARRALAGVDAASTERLDTADVAAARARLDELGEGRTA